MTKNKLGFLPRILIAITIGTTIGLLGYFANGNDWPGAFVFEFIVRLFSTSSGLIGSFISFMVPLIVIGLVVSAIADFGSKSKKMVSWTVGIAYVSTVIAALFAWGMANLVLPFLPIEPGDYAGNIRVLPFFSIEMAAIMSVMSALVFAFIIGIGISAVKADNTKKLFHEFGQIIEKTIKVIILPLLPLHIAGLFSQMAFTGTIFVTLRSFGLVMILVIVLQYIFILGHFTLASLIRKENPFTNMKKMLPAYFTAFGTQSSAATIPASLKSHKNLNISEDVAEFVAPLAATVHLPGSTISVMTTAIAVMTIFTGFDMSLANMIQFVILIGITMVAAAGIPAGGLTASIGLLVDIFGFTPGLVAMMFALHATQDSFGTGTNISTDASIAMMVDKIIKDDKEKELEESN